MVLWVKFNLKSILLLLFFVCLISFAILDANASEDVLYLFVYSYFLNSLAFDHLILFDVFIRNYYKRNRIKDNRER